ncbi:MAG: desulfoferrodoxin family protein [Sphaerochaetaceae bacterium]|jgi:superoxide reductase|nr:desulfoferrodoxin family protein [Sphaerochaetaceae bacterium]MDD3162839.1 desulfoferrodoxin family protein [Sphaerochaetaceae bacterium]MDD4007152.1 desulfoferrodoxin family protein [Sphaerochaetaceae bacterium]
MKLYICKHCGNIITKLVDSGVPVVCCGEKMQELVPNTVDAAVEKHVPVVTRKGNEVTVKVGAVAHPMIEKHYIEWIVLETKEGTQRKNLKPEDKPEAVFYVSENDEVVEAYAYCNLHGLWKN